MLCRALRCVRWFAYAWLAPASLAVLSRCDSFLFLAFAVPREHCQCRAVRPAAPGAIPWRVAGLLCVCSTAVCQCFALHRITFPPPCCAYQHWSLLRLCLFERFFGQPSRCLAQGLTATPRQCDAQWCIALASLIRSVLRYSIPLRLPAIPRPFMSHHCLSFANRGIALPLPVHATHPWPVYAVAFLCCSPAEQNFTVADNAGRMTAVPSQSRSTFCFSNAVSGHSCLCRCIADCGVPLLHLCPAFRSILCFCSGCRRCRNFALAVGGEAVPSPIAPGQA